MKHFSRQLLLIGVLILITAQLSGQTKNVSPDFNRSKDWMEKMQDKNVNFKDLQQSFNDYWKGRTDYKGNGYKIFKRWEYINEFRVLPDGKLQAPDYVYKTYLKYKAEHPPVKSASGSWSIVAPTSYPINNTSQPTGMGRVNAIAFSPTDATGNTIFVGSPSGGFWKSISGGNTWTDLSSNIPTLGVSSILIHPTNPDIIYLGSGDRDSDDAPPMGVFKSTDGGTSWTQMNNTMGNVIVSAMIMHPSDPNTIIAATSGGIYKTTDGGASWSLKASGNFKDIKFKPGDPTVVYAVKILTPSEFYRSSNTGDSWTKITSGIATTGIGSRMVIGVSPANASVVYLVQIKDKVSPNNEQFAGLLRSTDGGLNFTTQSSTPNIFDYACDGSGTASQATYDLCITVDPANANTIYVGSINNWKSTDGGVNWVISSMWSGTCSGSVVPLHADQHCYEWNNGNLYVGHDGGISYTANAGGSWSEITGNLAITQIYKIGQSATQSDLVLYGQQDNGSNASVGGVLTTTRGGDGAECAVDYTNTNYCFNTYILGEISRSTTGPTGSYTNVGKTGTNGIGADETGAWVTPYFLHKTDPTKMFAGYENVFRCDNIRATPATSVTWSAISTDETTTCKVLEQSSADVNILYVVRSGSIKRTDNANDPSVSWVMGVTAPTLPEGKTPTDLKAHPTLANVVYAAAGYKVYKSEDKGVTWTDISGTLPGLFINCLVIDKNANEGIYIGNQTGVWYKNALMPDWVLFSNGLPVVDIRELEIYYDATPSNNLLKAATYGRGLWQSDLAEISVINPSNVSGFPASGSQVNVTWTKNVADNDVMVAYSTSPTFGTPVNGTSYTAGNTIPGGGTVIYNGSGTSFSHSSLSPSTTYYYKAWSVNSSPEYSNGTSIINAMTDCATAYGLPFEENFSSGIMPDCWRQKDNLGNGEIWQFGTTTAGSTTVYIPALTGNYAYVNSYSGTNNLRNADLITPTLDLTNYSSNIILSFKHHFIGTSNSTATVYYSIDNGSSWTLLQTFGGTTNPSTYTSAAITALQGQSQVKFKWTYTSNAYTFYWAIDDIKITGTSTILPTVVTVPVTGVSSTTALSGGNVTSIGASAVTAKGVCWSTSPNPTVALTTKTSDGAGIGAYRSSITGLTPNTPYYVRAYATNTNGTGYGTQAILVTPPVAIAATSVTASGFTANWNASSEATNYSLDVSSTPFGNTALFENFNGFLTSGYPDYSSTLNNYLLSDGWTGAYVVDNIGNAIINSSSSGYICTPGLNLSGNGGNYMLYFDLSPYSTGTSKSVIVSHSVNNGVYNTVATIAIPASTTTQVVQITGGSSNSKIKIAVPSGGSSNRFTIDNIRIEASNMITGYTNLPVSGTSLAVTVPSVGVYYYRVRANGLNSTSANSNSISTTKSSIIAGGNWSLPATWSDNVVPTATDDVIISSPGPVIVDIPDAISKDLTVQSGATLQINPSKALTVNATLTNNSGTSGLVIKSDATGTGSLIHSTSNVNGTVERYLNNADWTNWMDGWHFLSSPVTSQAISPAFTTDPYDFYSWYEPENIWVNFKNSTTPPTWNTVNGSTNFVLGKGYMTAYDAEGTKQFSGSLNVADVSVSNLTITGTSAINRSWHLLGNPFASALTWDASSPWNLSNIAGVAKIWNEASQSYSDLTSVPSSVIPATNGFMVQVASGTGSLTLPVSKRVHSSQSFYKSANTGVKLIARNLDSGNAQESNIFIHPQATEGFDLMYDGEFLSGYAPQFYSVAGTDKLSTNSLPEVPMETGIPFAFIPNEGTNFSIEAKGLETFDVTTWLLDKKTNMDLNLTLNPVYNFTSTSTDIPDRFLLHFSTTVGLNQAGASEQSKVWYFDHKLIVSSQADRSQLEVSDLQGRIILKKDLNGKGIHSLSFNYPLGLYIARLTGNSQVKSSKFVTY